MLMMPDASTFRVLPWAPDTGWVLCDLQFPDGRPVPFDTRGSCCKARARRELKPTSSSPGSRSSSTSSGSRTRSLQPDGCRPAGHAAGGRAAHHRLPATSPSSATTRSIRVVKLLRDDLDGAAAAAALVRGRVRPEPARAHARAARRPGGRGRDGAAAQRGEADRAPPRLPRHLHVPAEAAERDVQRLASAPVADAKRPQRVHLRQARTSPTPGKQYLAGLLAHARGAAALRHADHQRLQALPALFARARPRDLGQGEPRRAAARGRRRRAIAGTRIENRIGEPAANPYLYFASQIYSGLDGIERRLPMPRPADTPYEAKADLLPRTLDEALQRLRDRQGRCAKPGRSASSTITAGSRKPRSHASTSR